MTSLFLIRHGDAEYQSADGSDAMRPLSERGLADIARQADHLKITGDDIACIFHSPFLRAVQTAHILGQTLGLELKVLQELRPSGSLELLENELLSISRPVIFVSHLPIIAEFGRAITANNIRFYPGTLVKIIRDSPDHIQGRLQWVQHPFEGSDED